MVRRISVEYELIYILQDWPQFRWNAERLVRHLSATRYEQGMLLGRMKNLGYQLKNEATLTALTEETVKSSAIEGQELNAESVRSSLARRMGLEAAGTRRADRDVEGVGEMMLDATLRVPSYGREDFGLYRTSQYTE